jgi:hypothetical protein
VRNPQNTSRRRRRKVPGGHPDQRFALLIEQLIFCVDGQEGRAAWRRRGRLWHIRSRTRIWQRWCASRHDPAVAAVARAVFFHEPHQLDALVSLDWLDLVALALAAPQVDRGELPVDFGLGGIAWAAFGAAGRRSLADALAGG